MSLGWEEEEEEDDLALRTRIDEEVRAAIMKRNPGRDADEILRNHAASVAQSEVRLRDYYRTVRQFQREIVVDRIIHVEVSRSQGAKARP